MEGEMELKEICKYGNWNFVNGQIDSEMLHLEGIWRCEVLVALGLILFVFFNLIILSSTILDIEFNVES